MQQHEIWHAAIALSGHRVLHRQLIWRQAAHACCWEEQNEGREDRTGGGHQHNAADFQKGRQELWCTRRQSKESGIAASSITSRPTLLPSSKGYRWAFVQGWCREERRGERRLGGLRMGHGEGWQVTAGFLRSWGAGEEGEQATRLGWHLHCDRQQEDMGREMAALAKGNGKRSLWGELVLWRYSKTWLCLSGPEVLQTWGITGEPWEATCFLCPFQITLLVFLLNLATVHNKRAILVELLTASHLLGFEKIPRIRRSHTIVWVLQNLGEPNPWECCALYNPGHC